MNSNICKGSKTTYSVNNRYFIHCYKDLSISVFKQSSTNSISVFTHSHPEYEFLIPITTIPYLTYEETMFLGEAGYVYPVQSGKNHGVTNKVYNISYIHIIVSKEFFETSIKNVPNLATYEFNYEFEVTPRLNILIDLFKKEANTVSPCEETQKHIAALICIELANLGLGYKKIYREKTIYPMIHTIKESADYILKNLSKEISIDDLAALCNLSRYHYIRLFKLSFGETPYNYLIKTRISKAKLLLANSNLSITEISLRCGFSSPNRFSEVFKEKNNICPSEYRRLNLQK